MSRAHAYPPDLARYVADHWPSAHPLAISCELLAEALALVYQASLTAEEARATRFRLLITPPDTLPADGVPNTGVLRLRFDQDRPMTVEELRRLAPSTPFETALIGACAASGALRIWGIAYSGSAWLAPTWGGRSPVPNWTYDPIIHVLGPGQLTVRSAGQLVGALEHGALVDSAIDVFDSAWLPALFARERAAVRAAVAARLPADRAPIEIGHMLIGRVAQHMLRRAIQHVRAAHHGGLILIVDTESDVDDAPLAVDGLRLKYRFEHDEPARRYRTLLLDILSRLADASAKATIEWTDFAHDTSPELERLEQSVFELSSVMADLTAIDGAVVLDKRFALRAFGAEVAPMVATSPQIWRALDLEATRREPDDIEHVGTRHRAAYRFVQGHPQGLALVVSVDGGVTFVANRDGAIVFWEQSTSP